MLKTQNDSEERLCPACGASLRPPELWENSSDDHKCGPKDWASRTNKLLEAILDLLRVK